MNENTSKFKNLIFSVFLQAGPWDQNKARKKIGGAYALVCTQEASKLG